MGVSREDISLTIIANNEHVYYSSVKGVGNLIWDIRLGIFSNTPPKADTALEFIVGTDWEDCTVKLDQPLTDPVYGSFTIDFDRKVVVDANGWGPSNRIFFDWLERSVVEALAGAEGLVPGPSLLDHFKHGRIQIEAGTVPYGDKLRFGSLEEARDALAAMKIGAWDANRKMLSFARISLPDRWQIINSGGDE